VVWRPDYLETVVLRDYLEIGVPDDDDFIARWITAVSRNIDLHCGRQFGKSDEPVTRSYRDPIWDRRRGRWVYTIDDVHDLDGMTVVDAGGDTVSGLEWEPENALADGVVYERVLTTTCDRLTLLSEHWGWPAVPASVEEGVLLFGARLAARRGAPFGTAGSPSDGSEIRLLAKLDPDMITTLKPYRRVWGAR